MTGYRDDTSLGGTDGRIPPTRVSAVLGMRSPDAPERQRSFETLVASYWKPAYKVIRRCWNKSNEDAKDLTQEFFARALEKGQFAAYDPTKARFRTYFMMCLRGFLSDSHEAAQALKRGGGLRLLPLDFAGAEAELARTSLSAAATVEEVFEKEWMRHLFGLALEDFRAECTAAGREVRYRTFEAYEMPAAECPKPTYEAVATALGIAVTDVTNHLSYARRRLRQLVRARLRDLTSDEGEYREEVRAVLGEGAS